MINFFCKPGITENQKFPFVPFAFILSGLYWIYLALTSQMLILYDAFGYEQLGTIIYQQGWGEFFRAGPSREPFYPFLISVSMHIADACSVSYHSIQKIIQILFLLTSQFLVLKILKNLRVQPLLCALTILYLGFSPALVNAAFSLFSEIAVFPFALGIVLAGAKTWQKIPNAPYPEILINGLFLGFLFIGAMATKAIFFYILFLFMLPYLFRIISFLRSKSFDHALRSIFFLFITLSVAMLFMHSMKSLNAHYNGRYIYTPNGARNLYGITNLRTDNLTKQRLQESFEITPGAELILFLEDNVNKKIVELKNQGVPKEDIDSRLVNLSLKKVATHPFRFSLFYTATGLKMLFWESTKTGFVIYPLWLDKIFSFTPFAIGLKFTMPILVLAGLLYGVYFIWINRKEMFCRQGPEVSHAILSGNILLLIFTFNLLHACFLVLPRFIFPVAPLYLILISFAFDRVLLTKKKSLD